MVFDGGSFLGAPATSPAGARGLVGLRRALTVGRWFRLGKDGRSGEMGRRGPQRSQDAGATCLIRTVSGRRPSPLRGSMPTDQWTRAIPPTGPS